MRLIHAQHMDGDKLFVNVVVVVVAVFNCCRFSMNAARSLFLASFHQLVLSNYRIPMNAVRTPFRFIAPVGYEVMPSNVVYTAQKLKLSYVEWDYTSPSPQAPAYKAWLKKHLAASHPIVWFPICKGDSHVCYPESCMNGGSCDHVEPMYGIFSSHPLDDPTVYDDDWILHASDQDLEPYYRPINSLDDTIAMGGNCAKAGSGFGKNGAWRARVKFLYHYADTYAIRCWTLIGTRSSLNTKHAFAMPTVHTVDAQK